jgi:serine/threonine protein kinase
VLRLQITLLGEQDKINICHDVTVALAALHKAEIIHGDVKAANVLVFHLFDGKRPVAKLSDFGSIILLDEARKPGQHTRYYGTSLTNAPETLAQSGENAIPHDMLARCDVYSLGLLYLHVVAEDLQAAWTSKSERVLNDAVNFVQQCIALSGGLRDAICGGLKLLLPYRPHDRCADLAVVLNLLRPFRLSDIADIW